MSYTQPNFRIFQLVRQTPSVSSRKATACLVGGCAQLRRYSVADEKIDILLGSYDHVGQNIDGDWKTCYAWPNKPVGSTIEQTYTKLYIDNALLRYFRDTGHTITRTGANKLRHPTKTFASHGAYSASADFLDRGAKVGDIVTVKATVSAVDYTLLTYIQGFEGETVAASVGSAAANSANQATAGSTSSHSAAAGNTGDADISSVSAASYSGYVDGNVQETYTVEVTQASTGSDLTTALLRITSASGNDDVAEQVPAASGYATAIGTRGATATFDDGGGDFAVGDKWTVVVRETWTKTVPTAAGTYTGTKDRTYIVEVTTGGISDADPTDDPYITVYATDGSDASGPTAVPTSAATAVAAGSYGATISFSTAKLRKGDRFQFTATAATEGAYKTLVLAHSLDEAIPLDDNSADIEISLYIKENISVPKKHVTNAGDYNWEQSDTELCVFAGVYSYATGWTNNGVPVALPVIKDSIAPEYNKMYVEYQAWLSTLAELNSISDIADLDDAVPGPLVQDNPLKYGLSKALENNNYQPVYYFGVTNPNDFSAWSDALEAIEGRAETYGLVPLTYDTTVTDAFVAHANSQSGPDIKRFRNVLLGIEPVTNKAILDAALSSDGEVVLATTEDDPNTSGTQYTLLRVTSGNANFDTLGVKAGDLVRIRYQTDAWGDETYETHVVSSVLGADQLRLATGTTAAENVGIKIEIWRTLSRSEQATLYAEKAAGYSNWRVLAILADKVGVSGAQIPNYFVACSVAGLISGVFQHQSLTNLEMSGYSSLGSVNRFTNTQLNEMAGSGVWLVVASNAGKVYNRHGVTTAPTESLNEREEMVRRNFDLICGTFDDAFSPQIGISNAVEDKLSALRVQFESTKEELRRPITSDLGPYLVDATITDLRIHAVYRDKAILAATFELPYPLNNLDAYFTI